MTHLSDLVSNNHKDFFYRGKFREPSKLLTNYTNFL